MNLATKLLLSSALLVALAADAATERPSQLPRDTTAIPADLVPVDRTNPGAGTFSFKTLPLGLFREQFVTMTNLNRFNVKDFGAVGDGQIANGCWAVGGSTTLIATNGHWTAGDVGKVISIYRAASGGLNFTTTIASFVNATNITLTLAPTLNATNRAAVYGTDDSAAIQSAVNFVAVRSGAGTIFFPDGIYLINDAVQDPGSYTNHHNAQIYVPDVSPTGQTAPTLRLEGATAPQTRELNQGYQAYTYFSAQGAVLWSTLPDLNKGAIFSCLNVSTPIFTGGGCVTGDAVGINSIRMELQNLTVRSAGNVDGVNVYLRGAQGCELRNVLVDEGYALYCVEPAANTNSCRLWMPAVFNNGPNIINNVALVGGFSGLGTGEHGSYDFLYIFSCYAALDTRYGGGHWNVFKNLDIEACKVYWLGGTCPFGVNAILTAENPNNPGFQPFNWDYPPIMFSNATPGAFYGRLFYENKDLTNDVLSGAQVEVVSSYWDGSASHLPTWKTPPIFQAGAYAGSMTTTGQTFGLVIRQDSDTAPAIALMRTTAAGNFWEIQKDQDSSGGGIRFVSSTNSGANLQTILYLNPVTFEVMPQADLNVKSNLTVQGFFKPLSGASIMTTGTTFGVTIRQDADTANAILLMRTTAAGNFWEVQKDQDSSGGGFRLNSSTNSGVNINQFFYLNPVTGQLQMINGSAGYLGNGRGVTNISSSVLTASSDTTLNGYEEYIFLAGNHSLTLGSAATNSGHCVTITCTSSGTNAILTVASQTIEGQTKWTNTAYATATRLVSDGSNWQIAGARGN